MKRRSNNIGSMVTIGGGRIVNDECVIGTLRSNVNRIKSIHYPDGNDTVAEVKNS